MLNTQCCGKRAGRTTGIMAVASPVARFYHMASPTADDATFRNFVTEATAPTATVSEDMRLCTVLGRLRASGWYYEGANAQAMTTNALTRMPAGRFFVRDSKHLERLFTMDVQTGRIGESRPISVRFTYVDGMFGLDMAPRHTGARCVPKFRCPIELVEYYVRMSRIEVTHQMSVYPTWVDQRGKFFSWMNLRRPMVKVTAEEFPSLKHLARLVINRHNQLITMASTSQPKELIEYLLQYPYSL
ncbi:cytokine-inducible SH2-containing protein-like [Metopolophium dirhodum]|uniref:cytokine-inducible SH2-containing protein-like n=1 Tax=Metopolophium dirhodum TaxID=44670 RepID=UPI00298FE597|nr:cytokine-inducible SH2-containing protein-like [Metopolophium dirhodum]